jgi:hypothetical protein
VGWVHGGSNVGLLGFVALVCVWVNFFCCSVGCLGQGLQGLGLCKVGIVGWSAGCECIGGRSCVVTGLGRIWEVNARGKSG